MAERADIAITVDGTSVGYLRDASVNVQQGLLGAAAEDAYGYRRNIPGVLGWNASGSVFIPSGGDAGTTALRTALTGRSSVSVAVTFETDTTETGDALVTTWEASGEIGGAVEGSFQLQGIGGLVTS